MTLTYLNLALLALSCITTALPADRKRDADMESLRGLTSVTRSYAGKDWDPNDKYFHESTFHPHYDGRFASHTLPYSSRLSNLTALAQTYLITMSTLNIETWIMHGSLLGWYWNRRIMPWDTDIDVQVTESGISYLAKYYNMTVWHFDVPNPDETDESHQRNSPETWANKVPVPTNPSQATKSYLLEINPHYTNASTLDIYNVIDARWIDLSTGLFIDITVLRRNSSSASAEHMFCKDRHNYNASAIFPLRTSSFESMPVRIPYSYAALLEEEYGADALTDVTFEGHTFDQEVMRWVPDWGQDREGESSQGKEFVQFTGGELERPSRAPRPSREGAR